MQIGQRIFNCTEMQIVHFISRINSETFDILHAFLSLVIAKLSDLKNSPVFWPIQYFTRETFKSTVHKRGGSGWYWKPTTLNVAPRTKLRKLEDEGLLTFMPY